MKRSSDLVPSTELGLIWKESGQSVLTGEMLRLFRNLDKLFLTWAEGWKAESYLFPPFISASELNRLDYFHSFPHLVTIPVVLPDNQIELEAFANRGLSQDGSLSLSTFEAPKVVLTPAACYHIYDALQSSVLNHTQYFTTCCVCHRREQEYLPLRRQWTFNMREIVCVGEEKDVIAFLSGFKELLVSFFSEFKLPVEFQSACDPFFNPKRNPKYLMQKLDPVKNEMIFGDLAIGSMNLHRNYFGSAFNISCQGKEAYSACVAFGLERWLHMLLAPEASKLREHLSESERKA